MDRTMKQRLLGIIVLLALLGLGLTLLLHKDKSVEATQEVIHTHPGLPAAPTSLTTAPMTSPATENTLPPAPVPEGAPAAVNAAKLNTSASPARIEAAAAANPELARTAPKPALASTAKPAPTPTTSASTLPTSTSGQLRINQPVQLVPAAAGENAQTQAAPEVAARAVPAQNPGKPKSAKRALTSATASAAHHAKIKTRTAKTTSAGEKYWAVQLGSFSERANAEALVTKLKGQGIPAAAEKLPTVKGEMTRVLAGKRLTRAEAEKLQSRLNTEFKLKGFLVPHGNTPDKK